MDVKVAVLIDLFVYPSWRIPRVRRVTPWPITGTALGMIPVVPGLLSELEYTDEYWIHRIYLHLLLIDNPGNI